MDRKKSKTSKIVKWFLISSTIVFSTITIFFIVLSYNLNYTIPEIKTVEIYDNEDNQVICISNGQKKSYVKLNSISKDVINAFLSIEDKRFYDHSGLDLIRIAGATLHDITNKNISQGASTITQQYARTLFLNSDKTIKRKLSEMMISLNLESKYSKDEILEGYLNSIYFDHGIYGIEDASQFYFNKHSADLTLVEACSLASIPKGPVLYSPIKNPENNKDRRNLILKELLNDSKISIEEYEEALNADLKLYGINKNKLDESAPYFQDYVMDELNTISGIEEYLDKGVKVYTTLDTKCNLDVVSSINNRINSSLEVATICIEPTTGKIKTLVGGKNYKDSTYNRATKIIRQPGSSIKPFLYLSALENGFNLTTTFMSEPTTFKIKKQTYSPTNFGKIYPNEKISMIYAIAMSDNIYAVKTHLFLGMDKLPKMLKKCGLKTETLEIASSALGTNEVNILNFCECYQVLANEGYKIKPYAIEKITTFDGELLYSHKDEIKKVADKADVFLLNEAMTNIFDVNLTINMRPTGASIASRLSNKFAGKSGTTDTDNWMVGYNKDLLCMVWTGFDDNREIKIKSDLVSAKYIWADVVESYFEDKNTSWYQEPNNVFSIDLNPITGFYASFDEYSKHVYFREDNIPWYIRLLRL